MGDDSNPPVSAQRDTAHPNSKHLHSIFSLMHVTDNLFKAVHYLCGELCEFPADMDRALNLYWGTE